MGCRSGPWLRLAVVVLLAASACGSPPEVTAEDGLPPAPGAHPTPTLVGVTALPTSKPGRWTKVEPWPYAPWYASMTAWTGKEMLLFGAGNPGPDGSPPPFSFRTRAAADAYDPVRDTWRPITPAPFPLGYSWAVAAGDDVYAAAGRREGRTYVTEVWKYSPATDRWRRLPDPPPADAFMRLTAAGDAPAIWHNALQGRASVHVYDADGDRWKAAPEVPWPGPAEVVGTPGGQLVVFGVVPEESPSGGPEPGTGGFTEGSGDLSRPRPPSPSREPQAAGCWTAAVLDPHGLAWRPLPASGIAVGSDGLHGFPKWTFAADRIVRAQRGTIAADKVAPGCAGTDPVPHGGAVDVDTGRWERLPELPGEEHGSYGGGFAPDDISEGGGDFVLLDGWAYDARRRAWSELPEIRDRELGFESCTYAWAGDRLLLFANAIHRPLDPEGFRTRVVRAREGWSWRPYADQAAR